MADNLGGDALANLALGLRVDRQHEIGMRLDVDKARRHHEPAGIDDPVGIRRQVGPDLGHQAVLNRDIGALAGSAAAVDHRAAANEDVPGHGVSFSTAIPAKAGTHSSTARVADK